MLVIKVGRTWLLAVVSSVRRAQRRKRKEETERNMAQIEGRKLLNASHWLFQSGLVSIAVCLHVLLLFETKSGAAERLAGIPWRAWSEPNLATSVAASGVCGVSGPCRKARMALLPPVRANHPEKMRHLGEPCLSVGEGSHRTIHCNPSSVTAGLGLNW